MPSVLSSEIVSKDHLRAFDEMVEARFTALELEKILIYMIDTVDAKALPFLAAQFNVLGLRGWNFAKTEKDQRDLIKRAVELQRYAGTGYSIRRALQAVGYAGITFEEGVGAVYDGYFLHDGAITYGGGAWALFRATVDLGESKGINAVDTPELIGLINTYKPQRSRLVGVFYEVTVSDTMPADDALTLAVNMETLDSVDPLTEEDSLIVTQAPIEEVYTDLTDSGIDLSVKNALGVELFHYNF